MSRGQIWILSEGSYCKIIETFNLGFIWRVRVVWGLVHMSLLKEGDDRTEMQ